MKEFEIKDAHTWLRTYRQWRHFSEAGNYFCSISPFLVWPNPIYTLPSHQNYQTGASPDKSHGILLLNNGQLLNRLKLKKVTNQYPKFAFLMANQLFRDTLFSAVKNSFFNSNPSATLACLVQIYTLSYFLAQGQHLRQQKAASITWEY